MEILFIITTDNIKIILWIFTKKEAILMNCYEKQSIKINIFIQYQITKIIINK